MLPIASIPALAVVASLCLALAPIQAAGKTLAPLYGPLNGGWNTQSVSFGAKDGAPESIKVWLPKASGTYPILAFVGGFTGNFPADRYSELLTQIAARGQGLIVVGINLFPANPSKAANIADRILGSLTYLQDGLQRKLDKVRPFFQPDSRFVADWSRLALSGHSSGAQSVVAATLKAIKDTSPVKVRALVLLDPVDGDPFKFLEPIISDRAKNRADLALLAPLPTLIFQSELCGEPGLGYLPGNLPVPPCCTPGRDGFHFWNLLTNNYARPGPLPQHRERLFVMAQHYGHADILDTPWNLGAHVSQFCKSVQDMGKHPLAVFRRFASGVVSGFMDFTFRETGSKAERLSLITNADVMPDTVFIKYAPSTIAE